MSRPHTTAGLAAFAAGLQLDTIPAEAIATASRLVTDTVAVAWAGAEAPGIATARQVAVAQGGAPQSRLWGSSGRLPPAEAAFVNAAAAAALDYDAVHPGSLLHADAMVLPVAVGLGEARRASGAEVLTAHIAGVEIAHRLALSTPRRGGWFLSSVFGVFGAAAAAARVMRLDAGRTAHALGIASTLSAGTKQAMAEQTLTKRLQTGFAARGGIQAALLAEAGVTGPEDWLDGQYGWYRLFEAGDAALAVKELGRDFVFAATGIKKYPACLACHAAIEAALQLVHEYDLTPDDVVASRLTIPPYVANLVGEPYKPGADAQVAAQFSIRYGIAAVLERGCFTLSEIADAATRAPHLIARAGTVAIAIDEREPGQSGPAVVTLVSRRHGDLTRRVEHPPGGSQAPLTEAQLAAKFADCLACGAAPPDPAAAARLRERLQALDTLPDATALICP